jgi:hypothetical protein
MKANAIKPRKDEVSQLKKDLSSEREKCKRLEADLSIFNQKKNL